MSWSRSARPRRRPAPPRPASPRPPRPSDDWPGGPVPPDPRRDAHVPGAAPPGGRVAHVDHAASRLRYGHRAEFAIGRLELVGNTGTYLDSPFHRYPDGPDVSALPLNHLVDLPTVVVDARAQAAADRRLDLVLACAGPLAGRAVLIRADWDERWGTQAYWQPGPYLGQVMIDRLVHARPALVGVDCWNVDDPDDPARPAHTQLLGAGIPVVEHLTRLGDVPAGARTFVVPLAIQGAPSVPVRAFALGPLAGT